MVKPLVFKGEKKPKKRKRVDDEAKRDRKTAETDAAAPEDDDRWVSADRASDVNGPVLLLLPTMPPTCLACDAHGSVFTMAIENLVDGHAASSAEPHDVRQVWVASSLAPASKRILADVDTTADKNKVVDKGKVQIRWKGHHGQFLGCSGQGRWTATAEAISPRETFSLVDVDGRGRFRLQTGAKVLAVGKNGAHHDITVRNVDDLTKEHTTDTKAVERTDDGRGGDPDGHDHREENDDGDADTDNTIVRIRMQARFKPKTPLPAATSIASSSRVHDTITRKEMETAVGRRLDEDEARRLRRAHRRGDYHERVLDLKVQGKHDKFG